MRFLLPQAVSASRQALQTPIIRASIAQPLRILSTTQGAWASHRANVPDVAQRIERPVVPPPAKTETELLASHPYLVRRTPSAQLPVYKKVQSGGTRIVILVKKVEGDSAQLILDLTAALDLKKGDIRLNPTTRHIEIKGNRWDKTKEWLLQAGF